MLGAVRPGVHTPLGGCHLSSVGANVVAPATASWHSSDICNRPEGAAPLPGVPCVTLSLSPVTSGAKFTYFDKVFAGERSCVRRRGLDVLSGPSSSALQPRSASMVVASVVPRGAGVPVIKVDDVACPQSVTNGAVAAPQPCRVARPCWPCNPRGSQQRGRGRD